MRIIWDDKEALLAAGALVGGEVVNCLSTDEPALETSVEFNDDDKNEDM